MRMIEDDRKFATAAAVAIVTTIAIVHTGLYFYWLNRVAFPTTLSHTGAKSAEQIYNANDPYYTVRKFIRQYLRDNKDPSRLILVSAQAEPPTRFDLEVYYELYPVVPRKVGFGSDELTEALAAAGAGDALISDVRLESDDRFTELVGENCFIYVRT